MIERLETAESPPKRSACRAGRSQTAVITNAITVTDFGAGCGCFTKGHCEGSPNLTRRALNRKWSRTTSEAERIMLLVTTFVNREDDRIVVTEPRMVSLGFGKFARSDHIYALEPLLGDERGDGHRTKVWVEGIKDPIIAARTEVTILRDMGQEAVATEAPLIDEALDLASRLAAAAEAGRVDLNDLGRRARRLLAATTGRD
jgi:hypothetical protein